MPKTIEHKGKKLVVSMRPIFYESYLAQNGGFLSRDMACHAMFYAYTIAQNNVKEIQEKLFYDNEPDQTYNFRALFKTIALIYDTDPDKMWGYIFPVEQQIRALGLSTIPREFFDKDKITRGTNDTIFERSQFKGDSQKYWEEVLKDAAAKQKARTSKPN